MSEARVVQQASEEIPLWTRILSKAAGLLHLVCALVLIGLGVAYVWRPAGALIVIGGLLWVDFVWGHYYVYRGRVRIAVAEREGTQR